MTEYRRVRGQRAEALAGEYLLAQGYSLLQRNYRCRWGEIDLIAEDPGGLVFVEVRSRQSGSMLSPEETITPSKAMRVVRSSQQYLLDTGQEDRPWRVDVIAVEYDREGRPVRVECFPDATSGVVSGW